MLKTIIRVGALCLGLIHCAFSASSSGVTSCAIRWDAWYSDEKGASAVSTSRSLSPSKWQFRAPIHARVFSSGKIDWSGASQTSFDNEIEVASRNNLRCWLYLVYGADAKIDLDASQMNNGFKFHRNSKKKDKVNYAIMVPSSLMGRTDNYLAANRELVKYMLESNYQTVLSGRPLLFVYFAADDVKTRWSGSINNFAKEIAALRAAAIQSGLLNPYIVVTTRSDEIRRNLGADAIGAYNGPGAVERAETWRRYESDVEAFWVSQAAVTTGDAIPVLMTGWDQRPRYDNPPAFQNSVSPEAAQGNYVQIPSNDELANEFESAINFVLERKATTDPAQLMVIYSWNENDEGGNALNPTLGDPTDERLRSISHILK